jgi:hypothetical protein
LEKRPELLAQAVFTEDELRILKRNRLLEAVERFKYKQR